LVHLRLKKKNPKNVSAVKLAHDGFASATETFSNSSYFHCMFIIFVSQENTKSGEVGLAWPVFMLSLVFLVLATVQA